MPETATRLDLAEAAATTAEPRISYMLARLERAVRRGINERVRAYDLTTPQYTVLSLLQRRTGLSNAQLARRAYMTPQSMSELMEALESKGLVERSAHPNHRRVLPAALTDEGHRVLAACDAAVDTLEDEMMRELAPAERKRLMAALKSCIRSFPEHY
jgi:DNA-binding MarR family transcriptional regulator